MYTCMLGMHLCRYACMRFVYEYAHGTSGVYAFVCVTYIIYIRVVCTYVCMYVCKHGIQVRVVWYGMCKHVWCACM